MSDFWQTLHIVYHSKNSLNIRILSASCLRTVSISCSLSPRVYVVQMKG